MNTKHSNSPAQTHAAGRAFRYATAAFVALFSLFSCAVVLFNQPTWPAFAAVAVELAIVTLFCWVILRHHDV